MTDPKVLKSKAAAVLMSLVGSSCPVQSGQSDGAKHSGGEKEKQIPPSLLAGLISTASKLRKNERTLADTRLEMENISQCGSGGAGRLQSLPTNIAKMKLGGQLDVVEYSRITAPE